MSLSDEQRAIANNNVSIVLRSLQEGTTQTKIAANLDWDASKVSRLKTEHLEEFCHLLSAVNLKIVPVDAKTIDEERLRALILLLSGSLTEEHLFNMIVG